MEIGIILATLGAILAYIGTLGTLRKPVIRQKYMLFDYLVKLFMAVIGLLGAIMGIVGVSMILF